MKQTIPITMTLPSDLIEEVDCVAKQLNVSRSRIIVDVLRRQIWLWRLSQLQRQAGAYAKRLGILSENDLERIS